MKNVLYMYTEFVNDDSLVPDNESHPEMLSIFKKEASKSFFFTHSSKLKLNDERQTI